MGKVAYIKAPQPFLRTLIHGLVTRAEGDPTATADMTLILPTRRAVRAAKDLFLDVTNGQPLLLPNLWAVGDVDAQDLTLQVVGSGGDIDVIPPGITDVDRQLALIQMVRARDPHTPYGQAVALARSLAGFMDQLYDEGLSLDDLDGLVAADYAAHWQLTVDFLSIFKCPRKNRYRRSARPIIIHPDGLVDHPSTV
jgi:ATP-dependent helicase/nuclease subunit B